MNIYFCQLNWEIYANTRHPNINFIGIEDCGQRESCQDVFIHLFNVAHTVKSNVWNNCNGTCLFENIQFNGDSIKGIQTAPIRIRARTSETETRGSCNRMEGFDSKVDIKLKLKMNEWTKYTTNSTSVHSHYALCAISWTEIHFGSILIWFAASIAADILIYFIIYLNAAPIYLQRIKVKRIPFQCVFSLVHTIREQCALYYTCL